MRGTPRFLLWLTPLALISCAIIYEATQPDVAAPEPPRLTMNHAAHLAKDLECIDCHDPDETGEPVMPAAETCFECHEDLTQENDRVRAYFDATRQDDGTYKFPKIDYMPGLIVNHKGHAGYKVGCADCHGEPGTAAYPDPAPLAFMRSCEACHTTRGAPNECATCHTDERKDRKPADHDENFLANHGKDVPAGWRDGRGESCAICHEVPNSCNECHTSKKPANHEIARFRSNHGQFADENWRDGEGNCALCHDAPRYCNSCHSEVKPDSHREAGFGLHHGTGDTDALDGPFKQTSCALCHEEQSCQRCHSVSEPRNHTNPFKRRLHGVAASVERQSCMTCHKQDSCVRCHQTTRPISHRGSFGTGTQAHCVGCHDPLPSNGCYTCHKNTLGHLSATPLPAGAPHATASDCRTCHTVLPHFDDGGNCRRCHR